MFSTEQRRAMLPWTPMGFCVFLSLVTIVANLALSVVNHTDTGGWATGFLCFLPFCFFLVGFAAARMQTEINELRRQIAQLRHRSPRLNCRVAGIPNCPTSQEE